MARAPASPWCKARLEELQGEAHIELSEKRDARARAARTHCAEVQRQRSSGSSISRDQGPRRTQSKEKASELRLSGQARSELEGEALGRAVLLGGGQRGGPGRERQVCLAASGRARTGHSKCSYTYGRL